MRFVGGILIAAGLVWTVLCFVGIKMMSRSVDMFTEAVLPSTFGLLLAVLGVWLLARKRPASVEEKWPSLPN